MNVVLRFKAPTWPSPTEISFEMKQVPENGSLGRHKRCN